MVVSQGCCSTTCRSALFSRAIGSRIYSLMSKADQISSSAKLEYFLALQSLPKPVPKLTLKLQKRCNMRPLNGHV